MSYERSSPLQAYSIKSAFSPDEPFPTVSDMEPAMDGRLDAPWCRDVDFIKGRERLQRLGFWLACAINLWCWL